MTRKHYEMTEETTTFNGRILHRIRAVKAFQNGIFGLVQAGDLGGWIESENNLLYNAQVSGYARVSGNARVSGHARVSGYAWVGGHAQVYGYAQMFGNAQVSGNAQVYGDAQVSGYAWVYGDAQVSGDAWVSGNAWVYGDAHIRQHGYIQSTDDYLTIGPIGSRNGYTTFYKTKDHGIWVCCGCFNGSIDHFRTRVHEVHAGTRHERDYLDAADFAARKLGKETENA